MEPGHPDHIEPYIIVLLLIMVQNSLLFSAKVMHESEPPQRHQQSQMKVKVTDRGCGFPSTSGGSFKCKRIHFDSPLIVFLGISYLTSLFPNYFHKNHAMLRFNQSL